ncbi:iron-siderophore ABC transporter substrate-binding protein [Ectobacillus antri]|jgi:iron complex transport system substrate-binding protein|uniref:Iron-siderophore ABC transporter substrate-binding protein n=1 Tax=Ectobacillus antri TaxID=2486280 RepID=A0ABT6H863_9BACI|nr:iron-siderophore ABC transporter substrate-binding protein [Ectobacillus antri]MDG4657348.1 iron-siderophore ABC transporter substrate-binding protein [Ectobacillus antri]MDG5754521.1 iron-siderophore ABC transporter substrate-binding protein [Ectobacillus antri]
MRNKNRSRFMSIMLLVSIVGMILAGCGTSKETMGENKEKAKTDEVRKVKHAMGETTIQGTPKRVVVLTNEGTEAVLELGVKPVGAVKSGVGETWFPHIVKKMEGVKELGEEAQPNLEAIASLKPDLILGNKVRHEKVYTQLSAIAPTVFSEDLAGRWKENFTLYAEALNKAAEGKKAMTAYDKHVADVKKKLGEKINTQVSLVRFLPTTVRIYQKDTFAGTVLNDVGIARVPSQDKDNFMEVITEERMKDMDGDIMFYFNADYDETKGGTKKQQEWMNHPLYKELNVAKINNAHQVDEVIWNLSGGIKAANLLLDDIVKHKDYMK